MKVGVFLPTFREWADLAALRELVTVCESSGIDSVWLPDRVAFPAGPDEEATRVRPMSTWLKKDREEEHWGQHGGGYRADQKVGEAFRDVYVMAGLLAGMTDRLEIGTSISLVPHRNPFATARAVATLDRLTEGRFCWGVGTGHVAGEYGALNLDYDKRHEMMDEWLRCIVALWTRDPVDFRGKYWSFEDVRMLLEPFSRPHPPILIGGNGKRALRLAAEIGAGWVPAYLRPDELSVGVEFLREQRQRGGGSQQDVDAPTVLLSRFRLSETYEESPPGSRPVYTPEGARALTDELAAVGCETLVAHLPTRDADTMKHQIELLADAVAEREVHVAET